MSEGTKSAGEGAFSFVSRRTLLKLGLAGGGVLLAAGGGVAGLRGCAPRVSGLHTLSAHHYRTLSAIARVHIPRGEVFPPGADDYDLARVFDAFLADEPHENVGDLKQALTLVEYGPLLFDGRLATFSNLPPDEQLAHWRGWSESRWLIRRQAAFAFRKFVALVFYDQEDVWPHIGYPGPSA